MIRNFLYIFFLLILFNNAYTKPIWEISNNWMCIPKLHIIINKNGEVLSINSVKNTTNYDFKNSKVNVVFDDGYSSAGKIIYKKYFENKFLKENIIVVDWENWGPYTSTITEEDNVFWAYKTSSGNTDNELFTNYRECYVID